MRADSPTAIAPRPESAATRSSPPQEKAPVGPRILFTTDPIQSPPTGVGRLSLSLLRGLVGLGADVTALDWRQNLAVAELGLRSVVVPPLLPWLRSAAWHLDLPRRVAAIPHDVLVDTSMFPSAFGAHPRRVAFVHDLSPLQPGVYRPGKRFWFRLFWARSLRHAARIVCISQATEQALLAAFPRLPAGKIAVVHPGLPSDVAPAAVPAPWPRPYFLYVGTLERRKNLVRLLDAFAAARRQGIDGDLLLVGRDGHGADAIRRRAQEADLRAAVHFLGATGDGELRARYAGAQALLFPSTDEGFGFPIVEAMQHGCCVLTSNVSSMPEVAGDAAVLVAPDQVAEIAGGIVRVAKDEGLRRLLRQRGYERVQRFSERAAAERLLAALPWPG
jgi:glycosyltransferase involved in cell wall biosynthesis